MRAFGLGITILMIASCSGEEDQPAASAGATAVPPVVVAEVMIETVPVIREFVARTEAVETVIIQARVEAVLEAIEFEEGKPVEKGQVLFRLDRKTYDANLSTAEAALARAQADLKLAREQVSVRAAEAGLVQAKAGYSKSQQDVARLEPLAAKNAVPQQDLDTALAAQEVAKAEVSVQEANLRNAQTMEEVGILQATAMVQSAEASVDLAKLDMEYCTITSPLDGLIGRTEVNVGNLVGRGEATHLATVSSVDPILVTIAISEEEFLTFQQHVEGQEGRRTQGLELILADNSVFEHNGKFIVAERAVQLETGTLQVVSEFPNPEGVLRPGQFGRVRAVVAIHESAVLVPQRAIMEQQGAKVVLVVGEEDKVSLRSLQVSERHESFFVVVDGLQGGESVIVEGQLKARPGQRVSPTSKPTSSEPRRE